MNKFNIGDRVRIVDDWPDGEYLDTVTTVTSIEKVAWNNFDYLYRLESNPFCWYSSELELVQDEVNINEKSVFELFQLESMK